MLAEFRVSNFRSFENEQVFSMEAGKVRNNLSRVYTDGKFKLLKFMAIYGANASGKSNFLEAFAFAQEIIVTDIPKNAKNDFCRVDEKNAGVPSHFEFTIKVGNICGSINMVPLIKPFFQEMSFQGIMRWILILRSQL